MEPLTLYVPIVGIGHRPPSCQQLAQSLKAGDPVTLVREPSNGYDGNAVQVFTESHEHIGYVGRRHAKALAVLLDDAATVDSATVAHFGDTQSHKWPFPTPVVQVALTPPAAPNPIGGVQ